MKQLEIDDLNTAKYTAIYHEDDPKFDAVGNITHTKWPDGTDDLHTN